MELTEQQQLDIETLLAGSSGPGRHDDVFGVPKPRSSMLQQQQDQRWKEFSPLVLLARRADNVPESISEDTTSEDFSRPEPCNVTVRGRDIGDLPTEYDVVDLAQNELPVIGTYVDPRICTGFSYRVRVLETDKYLFEGRALPLQSIGMGYGKRLTFKGEKLNTNSNYFYSDTQPGGYGFTLVAVETRDNFDICDEDNCTVGTAKVLSIDIPQREVASKLVSMTGAIEKHVPVTITCDMTYDGPHGLFSLQTETLQMSGIAVVLRKRRSAEASTTVIKGVLLPGLGMCRLCQPRVPLLA